MQKECEHKSTQTFTCAVAGCDRRTCKYYMKKCLDCGEDLTNKKR